MSHTLLRKTIDETAFFNIERFTFDELMSHEKIRLMTSFLQDQKLDAYDYLFEDLDLITLICQLISGLISGLKFRKKIILKLEHRLRDQIDSKISEYFDDMQEIVDEKIF